MQVIGTAGHVDHGKSALVERLTGIDPDRFEEEKRRGLTIDLGFAWLSLPSGREVGIIDVPGHERFIKNMLAGAGGIGVCLFVVAANEGWMPQSSEHLTIVDLLGVRSGVVALTKIDTVDDDRLELVAAEVEDRIAQSSLKGAAIVRCSAITGEGLDQLTAELDKALDRAPPPPDSGRPRLWIDRLFTISGAGTVVTGTLMGGALSVGDEVELSPEGRRARIRSLQSHKKDSSRIEPGNRAALNLVGLDRHGGRRGDAVVEPGQWRPTTRVDARLRVAPAELSGVEHELTEKGAHSMYVGSAETPVRVHLLNAQKLRSGQEGFAQLLLRDPLPLGRGDRFVLRDAGRVITFGGGEILDPLAPPARRNDDARIGLLERLRTSDAGLALEALVDAAGVIDSRDALLRIGAAPTTAKVREVGSMFVSAPALADLERRAMARVQEHHRENPLQTGIPRQILRARLGLPSDAFEALIAGSSSLAEEGNTVRSADFHPSLTDDQRRHADAIKKTLEKAGFQPPPIDELSIDNALLRALIEQDELVRIADFTLTRAQADKARRTVREEIERAGPITVARIRDLLQTSRRYAVPLCEWLDQTGATLRRGDVRLLGPNP